jgi:hypothetical protein
MYQLHIQYTTIGHKHSIQMLETEKTRYIIFIFSFIDLYIMGLESSSSIDFFKP